MKETLFPASSAEKSIEKQESPSLNIFLFEKRPSPINGAMKAVLTLFGHTITSVKDAAEILESAKKNAPDILLISQLDHNEASEEMRAITTLRNSPDISQQPLIIAAGHQMYDWDTYFDKMESSGADVVLKDITTFLEDAVKTFHSVPEFLGNIEDTYGDTMMKNKQGFYNEYSQRLRDRAEVTADTEQEIDLLHTIFQEHHVHTVVDAGGGAGRLAVPLSRKGYDMTIVDSSEELLRQIDAESQDIGKIEGDLRSLPLEGSSTDAITYNWHVFCDILGTKGKRKLLEEAFRVLKTDGVIVLDIPDRTLGEHKKDGTYIGTAEDGQIFIGYTPSEEEVRTYMQDAGFTNITAQKWKTRKDFPKITFIGEKPDLPSK